MVSPTPSHYLVQCCWLAYSRVVDPSTFPNPVWFWTRWSYPRCVKIPGQRILIISIL